MFVCVASDATRRQTYIGAIRIFYANRRSLSRSDVSFVVTLAASDSAVLPVELPTSFRVIELRLRRLPCNQPEIESVMLRVTRCTLLASAILVDHARVIASTVRNTGADLRVALKTYKVSSAAWLMTFRAVDRALEIRVRTGQRPGRNLRRQGRSRQTSDDQR